MSYSAGPAYIADEALGSTSMRELIETVYHARGAFWAGRSGGIGAVAGSGPATQSGVTESQFRLTSEISAETNTQKLGTGNVTSFPCNGTVGINGTFAPATESPNPFPAITDSAVKYGSPVYFKADEGGVLVITTGTMIKVSDGSVLTLSQLNKANDPAAEIGANEVFLVPTSALAKASSYSVHVVGTLNGTRFTKDFTFSTAPYSSHPQRCPARGFPHGLGVAFGVVVVTHWHAQLSFMGAARFPSKLLTVYRRPGPENRSTVKKTSRETNAIPISSNMPSPDGRFRFATIPEGLVRALHTDPLVGGWGC